MTKSPFSLLRSALYIPGSNESALAKAPTLAADAFILDLEDSVAPEAKGLARQHLQRALLAHPRENRLMVVRINGLASPYWQEDLQAIVAGRPDAIVIPKVQNAAQVNQISLFIQHLGGGAPALWPMIESPVAVLHAYAIASHYQVTCLVMGTADLAKEMRLPNQGATRDGLRYALQSVVLAGRGAGVALLDGVYGQFRDETGFTSQCQEGAAWGFDGKTLIHPGQIKIANQSFLSSPEEVLLARQVVAAWQLAHAAGEELCVVEGRMIERLHAQEAQRLLTLWEQATTR